MVKCTIGLGFILGSAPWLIVGAALWLRAVLAADLTGLALASLGVSFSMLTLCGIAAGLWFRSRTLGVIASISLGIGCVLALISLHPAIRQSDTSVLIQRPLFVVGLSIFSFGYSILAILASIKSASRWLGSLALAGPLAYVVALFTLPVMHAIGVANNLLAICVIVFGAGWAAIGAMVLIVASAMELPHRQLGLSVRRSSRNMLIGITLAICAFGVVAGGLRLGSSQSTVDNRYVLVVIATRDIPDTTRLAAGDVAVRPRPAREVPPNALIIPSDAIGRWTAVGISQDNIILETDIAAP